MKRTILLSFIILISVTSTTSCGTTRVYIGECHKSQELIKYDKSKQMYLFWGLIKMGGSQPRIPEDKNLVVINRTSFGDVIISAITLGIISTNTIKVKVPKSEGIYQKMDYDKTNNSNGDYISGYKIGGKVEIILNDGTKKEGKVIEVDKRRKKVKVRYYNNEDLENWFLFKNVTNTI